MHVSAYDPRVKTDTLFHLEPGSWHYTGEMDDAIHFVENLQLMDTRLWKLFVNQFRSNVDDQDHGWRCEYWGKMMRGACFTYAYTQDAALYRVMEETVHDLLSTQDALGRFSTYSTEMEFHGWDIWGRKYILLGLQYFYEICPDEALQATMVSAMCRHLDYIMEKIGPRADGKLPITVATDHWKGLNSSSLLEPVVRLYTLTGEKRYLRFADYIVANGGIEDGNIFELALEGKLYPYEYPVTKAYEMMSCFEGLLEYYRVTGIEKWRTAVEHFVRLVHESDITVIGCSGCTHELFDHSAAAQTDMERNLKIHMQETCVTVTWMKICDQLLCLNGKAAYVDAIEQSAYNALLGALNTEHNTSSMKRSFDRWFPDDTELRKIDLNRVILPFDSYSPLLPNIRGKAVGGLKFMENRTTYYGCCCAIGAAGTGLVPNVSVMRRKDGLAVNLYLNGTVQTQTPAGHPVTLELETAYPKENTVLLRVKPEQPEAFVLALRIPAWSTETALSVNGITQPVQAGAYAVLDRVWQPGDTITLALDFRVQAMHQDGYVSLRRGPIVLARDARLGQPVGAPVALRTAADGSVAIRPATASFACNEAFEVLQPDGTAFPVVDYASAGKTWDEQSEMAAWYPEKA